MNAPATPPAIAIAAATEPPKSKALGRAVKLIVLVIVLLVAAVYADRWWTTGRFQEETDDAYIGADVTTIGSKVSGYIIDLPVVDNQFVHRGDLLLRLDDRDYRAALAKAEGAVNAQEAALANLQATSALQQAVIARAAAEILGADAEVSRAGNDNKRYQDLVSRSSVSVESAQRADATFKTAEANAAKVRAEALGTRRQLDVIATQRQQILAALEQAKAERDIAQLNIDYTELRAPVDGYIGNKRGRVGAFAAAGSPQLSVVPAKGLWVDANFKEDQLARMRPGQRVTIYADAIPGKELHGRLQSLSPGTGAQFSILPAENATGNFTKIVQRVAVRIHLDDSDGKLDLLRPGLSVTAAVDTLSPGDAPDAADAQARATTAPASPHDDTQAAAATTTTLKVGAR